jgi:hypothetical protein
MRKPFDINAAIPAAWKLIWEHRRKMQAEEGSGFRDNNMHCTASDVENQVRQFAIDDAEGKPRGTMAWGRPTSWPPVRIHCARGTLQGVVRDWLLNEVRQGRIDSHNFGRHHISGMRFRPHGAPLSMAETKTIAKNEERRKPGAKPPPYHYSKSVGAGRPLCTRHIRRGYSSKAWTTSKVEKVTCKRCLNLLKTMKAEETTAA